MVIFNLMPDKCVKSEQSCLIIFLFNVIVIIG